MTEEIAGEEKRISTGCGVRFCIIVRHGMIPRDCCPFETPTGCVSSSGALSQRRRARGGPLGTPPQFIYSNIRCRLPSGNCQPRPPGPPSRRARLGHDRSRVLTRISRTVPGAAPRLESPLVQCRSNHFQRAGFVRRGEQALQLAELRIIQRTIDDGQILEHAARGAPSSEWRWCWVVRTARRGRFAPASCRAAERSAASRASRSSRPSSMGEYAMTGTRRSAHPGQQLAFDAAAR